MAQTYSHILSDIHFDILSDILSHILSGILSGPYSDISSCILSDILLDEEEKATLITSRNPHLAGGEIHIISYNIYVSIYIYIYTHTHMLVGGFNPSEKYEFVSWDYYPQYMDPPWYRSKGSSPGKKCLKSFGPQPFGIDFQRVQPNRFKPTTKLQFPGQTN